MHSLQLKHCIFLLLFVLASHMVVLLNHAHYWDGWLVSVFLQKHDFANLWEVSKQIGLPQTYYLNVGLNAFPDFLTAYRITLILCMLIIAFSLLRLSRQLFKLPLAESLFIAAFSATWPFYNVFLSETFLQYITSLAFFYVGWTLYFHGRETGRKLYTAAAFLLLGATCLTIHSLLAYYYGFVLACFLCPDAQGKPTTDYPLLNAKTIGEFCKRHAFLILFPFALLIIKILFLRPYGMYQGYNSLAASDQSAGDTLLPALNAGRTTLLAYFDIFPTIAFAWPAIFAVAVACIFYSSKTKQSNAPIPQIQLLALLGIVFCTLAIIPYAAVGKAYYHGWGGRHTMLLAPAFAFLLTALGLQLKRTRCAKAVLLIYGVLLFINSTALNAYYMKWQIRGLMDESVIQSLASQPPAPDGTLIVFTAPNKYINDAFYRPYELSGMLYSAWKQEKWYAVQSKDEGPHIEPYLGSYRTSVTGDFDKLTQLVSEYNPTRCVATVIIQPPTLSDTELLKGYYTRRIFAPSETAAYVKGLFSTQLEYPTWPNAHCDR